MPSAKPLAAAATTAAADVGPFKLRAEAEYVFGLADADGSGWLEQAEVVRLLAASAVLRAQTRTSSAPCADEVSRINAACALLALLGALGWGSPEAAPRSSGPGFGRGQHFCRREGPPTLRGVCCALARSL